MEQNSNSKHDVILNSPIQVEIKKAPETAKTWYEKLDWSELVKWLIGTVGLGLFGLWINNNIQEKQMDKQEIANQNEISINKIKADAEIINAISAKFDTVYRTQLNYLHYIQPFAQTDDLKVSISVAIKRLDSISKAPAILNSLNSKSQIRTSELSKTTKAEFLKDSTVSAARQKPQQDIVKDEIAKGPGLRPVTTSDSIIHQIQKFNLVTVPSSIANYKIDGDPQTLWCKKNYFQIFLNTLKIGIDQLDQSGITVNITELSPAGNSVLDPSVTITSGSKITRNSKIDGTVQYVISLDYIGNAGVNPFKKAAFITVTRYSLQK
jgi:hypothetical protein